MGHFQRTMRAAMDRVGARHRICLGGDEATYRRFSGDDCICSAMPDIEISHASYTGRRRRIRLSEEHGEVTFLARLRPPPSERPNPSDSYTTWATNLRGEPVPVSRFDVDTGSLHILVEVDDLLIRQPMSAFIANRIVRGIFANAIPEMEKRSSEVVVGKDVANHIGTFLEIQPRARLTLFHRELLRIEGHMGRGRVPIGLARRCEALREATRKKPVRVSSAHVEEEIQRLERLVSSRACARIRFRKSSVECITVPRRVGGCRYPAVKFTLTPSHSDGWPELRFSAIGSDNSHDPCLGTGSYVFPMLHKSLDVFALVDTALNFIETNRVQATQGWHRRLPQILATFF